MWTALVLLSWISSPVSGRFRTSLLSTSDFCKYSRVDGSSLLPVCSRESITLEPQLDSNCLLDGLCNQSTDKVLPDILRSNATLGKQDWIGTPQCISTEYTKETFCVHTSHDFARGRGISIFTTPQHAEKMHQFPAFVDPTIHDDVNGDSNPPYISQKLPGRGVGLIANRTLHAGDRIFSNTPVLILHGGVETKFSPGRRRHLLHSAITNLPPDARQMYMDLHGHFGGDPVQDIMNTNSFSVHFFEADDDGAEYYAVIPEISRLNHDCRPNAHYYFDHFTLTHHVHAIRTILPGEELTISYIDPAQTREQRLDALEASWGFKCSCSQCTMPTSISDASDHRIFEIAEIVEQLEDWSSASHATPEMGEYLVSLYKQERMWGPLAEAYTYAAIEYNAVGKEWKARELAALAVQAGLLYGGPYDEDVNHMQRLLQDPQSHWSWKLRH